MKVYISVFGKFHAFDLARELDNKGHLYKIFTTYPKYALKKYNITDDKIISLPIFEVFSRARKFVPFFFLNSYLKNLSIIFDWICSLYINSKIDVFIGWSGFAKISMIKCKKLKITTFLERGSAHIVHQRKVLKNEEKKQNVKIFFPEYFVSKELEEYRLADQINVPSNFSKKTFPLNLQEKLFVNSYGVDVKLFCQKKNIKKKFIVLYVGGLSIQKGSHYLLKAMSQLINNGNSIEFWHVGSIDKQMNIFIKKYKNLSIIFFGHKSFSSLPKYYSKSSVFCIPSIHDGLALVIPQALACGLPVICTKNSGGSEFVKNGVNGFLVKPYSATSIQNKILKLYNDRKLLKKMSMNSNKIKKSKLLWNLYGHRLINKINLLKEIEN